jgi:uncharacterized membrane protein (UPF0136 family)
MAVRQVSEVFIDIWRRLTKTHRRSQRFKVKISLSCTLSEQAANRASESADSSLVGYTRDLSEHGLGLILPSMPAATAKRLVETQQGLTIMLALPIGYVALQARAVRLKQLNEPIPGVITSVIGARIESMSDFDRRMYAGHLRSLRASRGPSSGTEASDTPQ